MAVETSAGDDEHALALLLPAAIANVTPEAMALLTALSSVLERPPPRDMFATAGWMAFDCTQFTPAMTPEVEPEPLQSRTRTATSDAPFATPYVLPPTVPET